MIRVIFITVLVFVTILSCFLVPKRFSEVGALPENLWTASGQWQQRSEKIEVLRWRRTQYGYPWTWMVHDRGVTEPAWYVRVDEKYLIFYAGIAFLASGIAFVGTVGSRRSQRRTRRER